MNQRSSGLAARPGDLRTPGQSPAEEPGAVQARQALRRLASGVTVLTVNRGRRHGTTASAVITVSRDPLVLGVCLSPSSSFAGMVRPVGRFTVNVLAAGQAPLAQRFADPDRPLGDAQFEGLDWSTDPLTGAPLLDGCLAHLACRALDWHQVGDHDLLLAEVLGGRHATGHPMIGFAGRISDSTLTDPADPSPLSEVS